MADYIERQTEKHLREKLKEHLIETSSKEKIDFTGVYDRETEKFTDPNTGKTYTGSFHGTPHRKADACIKVGEKHAHMVRDQDPYLVHDPLGRVLLIHSSLSENEDGHTDYFVKDIEEDTLYPIEVYTIANVTPIEDIDNIQDVRFSPDGKHLFCGVITSGLPEEGQTFFQWGYIKDFQLTTNESDEPVITGDFIQGTYILDDTALSGYDLPPDPPIITSLACNSSSSFPGGSGEQASTLSYEEIMDEAILGLVGGSFSSISARYVLSTATDEEATASGSPVRVDCVGTYALSLQAYKFIRKVASSCTSSSTQEMSFHCLGSFCNGELLTFEVVTEGSNSLEWSYGAITGASVQVANSFTSSVSREGCLAAFSCSDNGFPPENPGKCGPLSNFPDDCGASDVSGGDMFVIDASPTEITSLGLSCGGGCGTISQPVPPGNQLFSNNYNKIYGVFAIEFMESGGVLASQDTRLETKRTTIEQTGLEPSVVHDFVKTFDDDDGVPFSGLYGVGFKSDAGVSAAAYTVEGSNDIWLASPYINPSVNLGNVDLTAFTDDDIFTDGFILDPAAVDVFSVDSALFETLVRSGANNDVTAKRLIQKVDPPTEATIDVETQGTRADRTLYGVDWMTTRNED